MRKIDVKKGFTLIELSLSLVFIAILSLTVAYVINDAIATYRRGLTLNQVNTFGMDLVDDMRASVQNSSTKSIKDYCAFSYDTGSEAYRNCEGNNAKNFVVVAKNATIEVGNNREENNVPVYGAFCSGTYSYIWNSGYFFTGGERGRVKGTNASKIKFKTENLEGNDVCEWDLNGDTMTCSNFRLLKIKDESRAICAASSGYDNKDFDGIFDISGSEMTINEMPIDLLASTSVDDGFALYNLYASLPAESTAKNAIFYSVSFVLGTVQGGASIKQAGNFCVPPNDIGENFDYCSINKFNFAAEATGGK